MFNVIVGPYSILRKEIKYDLCPDIYDSMLLDANFKGAIAESECFR